MSGDYDPIVVYAGILQNASLVKQLMEEAGLVAVLRNEATATIGQFIPVEVAVRRADLEAARRIVEAFLEGESDAQQHTE